METFTEPKQLADNPDYHIQRAKTLSALTDEMIDTPISNLINAVNNLPYCFTLQSCYGHFVYSGQKDPQNVDPLPRGDTIAEVEYRIAYIALCIENSLLGRELLEKLKEIPAFDPEYVQCCCAEWFWERHINSYAVQVEPDRFKDKDTATVDFEEALHIEQTRDELFIRLHRLLEDIRSNTG